jgi:ribosomal protein S18 acetylase RimI-like enzyme
MTVAAGQLALRPAGRRDDTFLRRLYASLREEELAVVKWNDVQRAAFLRQQFNAQDAYYREHYRPASFDVIELDGEAVGRLYVARWADEIRIIDISLLPEHRSAGIGTHLIRSLLDEAAVTGKRLSIHVEKHNPALRLYKRLGFSVAEDKGVYLFLERPSRPT